MCTILKRYVYMLGVVVVLLSGCSWFGSTPARTAPTATSQTGQQFAYVPGKMSTTTLPQGWRRIFNGGRFAGGGVQQGLVASAARSGRLAGCVLPAAGMGHPFFALSDDLGQTWQVRGIPHVPSTFECRILADTQLPDVFAVSLGYDATTSYVTSDAGLTWHTLAALSNAKDLQIGAPLGIVGGHILAILKHKGIVEDSHPAEAILQGEHLGLWQTVDAGLMSLLANAKSPPDFTLDASDPAYIYATVSTGSFGYTVFVTSDAGASWHAVLSVPTAKQVSLRSAAAHQVYLEVLRGQDAPFQLFYSRDGGGTWKGIALHYRSGGEPLIISPQGRIITITYAAASINMFALDPDTGIFSTLGVFTFDPEIGGLSMGTIVDGPTPLFFALFNNETDVLSLPPR